ncbi:MAG: PAS domain S-box protein [Deltaproteobacteria bacterium]|nr:PAS domain S-box protein [Deltaproteobacteria bacterium]
MKDENAPQPADAQAGLEQELLEVRARLSELQMLFDEAPEAIFVLQGGDVKLHNKKTREVLGYEEEELKGLPFYHHIHPDDREMVLERYIKRQTGKGFPYPYRIRILKKNGDQVEGSLSAARIEWRGEPAVLCVVRDHTRQAKAEALWRPFPSKGPGSSLPPL